MVLSAKRIERVNPDGSSRTIQVANKRQPDSKNKENEVASSSSWYKKKSIIWIMLVGLVVIAGVGAGIAVTVVARGGDKNGDNGTLSIGGTTESSIIEDNNDGGKDSTSIIDDCVPGQKVTEFDRNELTFYPMEFAVTYNVDSKWDCVDACTANGYSSCYYDHPQGQEQEDRCKCIESTGVECLAPWGDSIGWTTGGELFTTECYSVCDFTVCEADPIWWKCFTGHSVDAEAFAVYASEGNGGAHIVASKDVVEWESDCLEFCKDYPVAMHAPSTDWEEIYDGNYDQCRCYDQIQCLIPLGNINTRFVTSGTIFTKEDIEICDFDYCEMNPNSWLCLTSYQYGWESTALYGQNLTLMINIEDEEDDATCLETCSLYDVAVTDYSGQPCLCYNAVECLLPWGDGVDTTGWLSIHDVIYSKHELSICEDFDDYCQAYPNGWYCFTNQESYLDEVDLFGTDMIQMASGHVDGRGDCQQLCEQYSGARYESSYRTQDEDNCFCFNNIDCLLPWGEQVGSIYLEHGFIYTKGQEDIGRCDFNYCDAYYDSWYCFTGIEQKYDLHELFVYGENILYTETESDVANSVACLKLCASYFAVVYVPEYYANIEIHGDCHCFDNVDCLIPYGEHVDLDQVAEEGWIYTKQVVGICDDDDKDFCDVYPTEGLCFTAHETNHQDYTLYGSNMIEMISSDVSNVGECRNFCGEHFAIIFIFDGWWESGHCTCYDNVECLLPWGDEVSEYDIEFGYVYTKEDIPICSFDYCTTFPDDDTICSG